MNGRYWSLPALPIITNCTKLLPLKNNCAVYFIVASAANKKNNFENFLSNDRRWNPKIWGYDNFIAIDIKVDYKQKYLLSQTHFCLMFIKKFQNFLWHWNKH